MSLYIENRWVEGEGQTFSSVNPASGEVVWSGRSASVGQVEYAVSSARSAAQAWADLPVEDRIATIEKFIAELKANRDSLARTISREIGKPTWESLSEVDAMIGKGPLSIRALRERRSPTEQAIPGGIAATRYKPIGVVAVFGPFNFPGHLPNGHIIPALLAGNTVLFKPSELAPAVAQATIELWHRAGLPAGVMNLLQGGRETGAALLAHAGIDGFYFTGSVSVGIALARALADRPDKILALEMGGNNPLIVHQAPDIAAAVHHTIHSAFITAGQRCTCARRLILPPGNDDFLAALIAKSRELRIGAFTDSPEPFLGPVISHAAAGKVLLAQAQLQSLGGRSLLEMKRLPGTGAMLSPGIIDVTGVSERPDEEIFGPILQVIRVGDFAAAIDEANRTRFGLAAGLLSDRRDLYEQFYRRIRAGVVSWNRPTTGASGTLPFGGVQLSGNHRPSGYWSADYCSYPVASIEVEQLKM